jgi:hypothetical protein
LAVGIPVGWLADVTGDLIVGVVGGAGGVGASTFAAVLALACGGALLDLDGLAGGVDVLLGIEGVPGARWSHLRLAGGRLDPAALAGGLPRWGSVPVLAADAGSPSAEGVSAVLDAALELGPVALDLPRAPAAAREVALSRCALVTVVVPATVSGVAAARAVCGTIAGAPIGLLIRRGQVPARQVGRLVGAPVLGVAAGRWPLAVHGLNPGRVPGPLRRVARGVLDGLAGPDSAPASGGATPGDGSGRE